MMFRFSKKVKQLEIGRKASQNYSQPENIEDWINVNKLAAPCPAAAKWMVLERHHIPGAVWIETGTHLGGTTRFLAGLASKVITLEPSEFYFQQASKSLAGLPNVETIHGSSEEHLDKILKTLKGKNVCLWLDGHWSGGETWCGKKETPILLELATVAKHQKYFAGLSVLIDDYRLCWSCPNTYPKPSYYIRWAEKNSLSWTIEQDIFVARSPHLPLY